MSLISIRLAAVLDAPPSSEAKKRQRPKSEIAREVIFEYLSRRERERFLVAIAKAARGEAGELAIKIAEEALPLDVEALDPDEGRAAV